MLGNAKNGRRISGPIVRIAEIGIALGIAIMILSVSISTGFQAEVRNKVIGFEAHYQITEQSFENSYESRPIQIDNHILKSIDSIPEFSHAQTFAIKPAILQSKTDQAHQHEIAGIVVKGIDENFDYQFIQENLVSGKCFQIGKKLNDSILISKSLCNKLGLQLHDKVSTFFVQKKGPKQRKFVVGGIFETSLTEFDQKFIFCDIGQLQQLNNWGIRLSISFGDSLIDSQLKSSVKAFGGDGSHLYSINGGPFYSQSDFMLPINSTRQISIVASDFEFTKDDQHMVSVPDTLILTIDSVLVNNEEGKINLTRTANSNGILSFAGDRTKFNITITQSGFSRRQYIGGYEVFIKDFDQLQTAEKKLEHIAYPFLEVQNITATYPEIFGWLNMLDTNVYIIIALMVIVGIINMISALLILILERTNMIGVLKVLGSSNWTVRKVFVYQGAYLVGRGLLWGNIAAGVIIWIQNQFHLLTLPREGYYLDIVPMYAPIGHFLAVNLGAFVACSLALILPSYLVTKITPIKVIKMD